MKKEISIKTIKSALWWVQNGLDNVDMSRTDHERTKKCRDELRAALEE